MDHAGTIKMYQTLTSRDIDVQSQSVHVLCIMHPCLSTGITPITCFMYHAPDITIKTALKSTNDKTTKVTKNQHILSN